MVTVQHATVIMLCTKGKIHHGTLWRYHGMPYDTMVAPQCTMDVTNTAARGLSPGKLTADSCVPGCHNS